jgi:copper/silver efflux system protein
MLHKIIHWSMHNPLWVVTLSIILSIAGLYALAKTPLDAIPDLSDTQVILYTAYDGQAPQLVEDQVSYPLVNAMMAVPNARVVRGFSYFGVSYIYVIFEDGTPMHLARARVAEALTQIAGQLPAQAVPRLGPDASGVGWVYQYALQSTQLNLAQQRSLQDSFVRGQLSKVSQVAEVASIGGVVQQYQVAVDPLRLRALDLDLMHIRTALQQNNQDVGARALELSETEYMIRGQGYLKSAADIGDVVIENRKGLPIRIRDVAQIELGSDERRGIAEWNGEGEAVSGIVLARQGENVLDVIHGTKQKLKELTAALSGDTIFATVYDRSVLIKNAIHSLNKTLLEECIIVALVCMLFLLHARSALVAIITLPVAILAAFVVMRWLNLSANIMSLGGIAIAMGAMIDAAVVMIENAHKHLERSGATTPRFNIILKSCGEVGPALFISLLIITLSFLPLLALTGQEEKLFTPLVLTKSLAMAAATLLSITLIPVLMLFFIRGPVRPESANPLNRWLIKGYRPCLDFVLRHAKTSLLAVCTLMVLSFWPLTQLGSEFMPTLNEGDLLYMPTAQPGISVTQAKKLLQNQDKIIKQFPEVASVMGKAGRANTATDPAPLEMFETLIQLKPAAEWRAGMTVEKLIADMDQALTLPGIANSWTMPIKARIDMLSTGIRTPLGIKLFGQNLAELERISRDVVAVLKTVPGTTSAYAEQTSGAYYLNITPDPQRLALYGVSREETQQAFASAVGGDIVTYIVQGRERVGVNLRYARAWRSDPETIAHHVLVRTDTGAMIPLAQLAHIEIEPGSPGIRTENGLLSATIFVDTRDRDVGSYVADARQKIEASIRFPTGYYSVWSGQFEHMERAYARLSLLVPATVLVIFLLLYLNFKRFTESLIVLLSIPFAMIGGIWLVWLLNYNISVPVIIGFIGLAGVAAETGVVMLLYLNQALQPHIRAGEPLNKETLYQSIMEGAVARVRPKMMTVCAIIAGLLPILWNNGVGHEVMQRIAAPMVGGMLSSCILTLLIIPILFAFLHSRPLPQAAGYK